MIACVHLKHAGMKKLQKKRKNQQNQVLLEFFTLPKVEKLSPDPSVIEIEMDEKVQTIIGKPEEEIEMHKDTIVQNGSMQSELI